MWSNLINSEIPIDSKELNINITHSTSKPEISQPSISPPSFCLQTTNIPDFYKYK